MSIGVRRLVAALVTVFAVLLTGCTASGVIEVRSADEVMIDVTINHGLDEHVCTAVGTRDLPLTVTAEPDEDEPGICRISGTVHPELLREYVTVTHAGELFVITFNPLTVVPGVEAPNGWALSTFTELDLAVRFPGQVTNTSGEADGNVARFRDPKQFIRPYGLRAEALDHPGPAWSVIGPIAGFLAGAAAAVLAFALWRRRGVGDPMGDPEESTETPDAEAWDEPEGEPMLTDEPPTDHSAAGPAESEQPWAPPAPDHHTPDPPRRRPDDSIWAPPDD